ncbi:EF-Hand 1, calcium-binding site,EF-hand domain pair,EF-hand domain [Cinara cedri]|uniref:EF-Hand 1, calcium-binding site,EF-hand domain pair,EF-hand domain n=1 Tax=Cinara cedri TaxID=506608 RepID=A0A5E4N221_9HEMI|nr:EF-Hand 1, calcium-binding site,EF-hand domain pair,EF-hand domain [Cinara cedri]
MAYFPINKGLTANDDIRLQHKYAGMAGTLARETDFTKKEVIRLIEIHFMMTKRQNRTMDKLCFTEFMDTCLGFRNADAVEKMHRLFCVTNRKFMTERDFVVALSLLLMGSVSDSTKFCFNVYTEMIGSPEYITKDDVLLMARKSSAKMSKGLNNDEIDHNYVEFVMSQVDRDRDNRISLDDYRKTVNENVMWMEFLGEVLPTPENIQLFVEQFTLRPYVNKIEVAWENQHEPKTRGKKITTQSDSTRLTNESLALDNSSGSSLTLDPSLIDQMDDTPLETFQEPQADPRNLHLF